MYLRVLLPPSSRVGDRLPLESSSLLIQKSKLRCTRLFSSPPNFAHRLIQIMGVGLILFLANDKLSLKEFCLRNQTAKLTAMEIMRVR